MIFWLHGDWKVNNEGMFMPKQNKCLFGFFYQATSGDWNSHSKFRKKYSWNLRISCVLIAL